MAEEPEAQLPPVAMQVGLDPDGAVRLAVSFRLTAGDAVGLARLLTKAAQESHSRGRIVG